MSTRSFAESRVRIATGPYRGQPFRIRNQPFTGVLFDAMDSGRWPTIVVTGPSQSSKTLSAFVIPTLRDAIELRESPLIVVPEADMAADKWDRDFLPTLRESPELMWLIPKTGSGARGGRIRDRVTLGNGVDIKVMSRGGQDTAKAGYTASRVRVTEAAGLSHSAEASHEADTLRQIIARMRSFKSRERSLIVEGTGTVADELPWRLRGTEDDDNPISTRSRLVCECPHNGCWITPERQHLVGWQDARSVTEARDKAAWACPQCGELMDDSQRRWANERIRMLHFWESIDASGRVVVDESKLIDGRIPVDTLWFRWNAFNNLLLDAADTASDEWKAAQIVEGTIDRDNAERELCQFVHAIPYKPDAGEDEPLKPEIVRKRRDEWPRSILPPDTQRVTVGLDIGKFTSWWVAVAFREGGQLYVPAYGAFDVCRSPSEDISTRIVASLQEFNETVVEQGFTVDASDGAKLPDVVVVDCGYMPDDVAEAVRSFGRGWGCRWKMARGRGRASGNRNGSYTAVRRPTKEHPWIGTHWHAGMNYNPKRLLPEVTFDADYWKIYVHDRLRAKPGAKGALTLYRADMTNEHAKISHHWCSEQFVRRLDPKKGLVEDWVKTGQNHWLDATAMACMGGDIVGWRLPELGDDAVAEHRKPLTSRERPPTASSDAEDRPFFVGNR